MFIPFDLCGSFLAPSFKQRFHNNQYHTDTDRRIGYVENGKRVASKIKLDKIDNLSGQSPIQEVTNGPPKH
jgi:hypothetical protein